MNTNALILMALFINHHVGFVQNKDFDFLDVKYAHSNGPIEHFAGRANDDVLGQLGATFN